MCNIKVLRSLSVDCLDVSVTHRDSREHWARSKRHVRKAKYPGRINYCSNCQRKLLRFSSYLPFFSAPCDGKKSIIAGRLSGNYRSVLDYNCEWDAIWSGKQINDGLIRIKLNNLRRVDPAKIERASVSEKKPTRTADRWKHAIGASPLLVHPSCSTYATPNTIPYVARSLHLIEQFAVIEPLFALTFN